MGWAFVGGWEYLGKPKRRYQAFCEALKERGIASHQAPAFQGKFPYKKKSPSQQEQLAGLKLFLLANRKNLDALICFNDATAFHVLDCAKELGIRVPEELAVTGFDNLSTNAQMTLTTLVNRPESLAEKTVQLCLEIVQGKRKNQKQVIYLPSPLRLGQSTQRIPNEAKSATEWLKEIEVSLGALLDSKRAIETLAKQKQLSPSRLKTLFKQRKGETLSQWLRSKKLEKAVSLLKQKKLNLTEIAMQAGYANRLTLYRHIKKQLGTLPATLRNQTS